MIECKGAFAEISAVRCIEDWCVVHWAIETDQWGNKLDVVSQEA